MKKNKVFRDLVLISLWRKDRPRGNFDEGSFIVDPKLIETRFKVLLKLYRAFDARPTKELVNKIDNYVSKIALLGFDVQEQVQGAFWGIVFEYQDEFFKEVDTLFKGSYAFNKRTIKNSSDLEHFYKFLDELYDRYSEPQREEMMYSLRKFGELLSPCYNDEDSPRIYTFDDRVSLPASYAAYYWVEMKEEEIVTLCEL